MSVRSLCWIGFLVASGGRLAESEPDLRGDDLAGKVREVVVEERVFSERSGIWAPGERITVSRTTYDRHGNRLRRSFGSSPEPANLISTPLGGEEWRYTDDSSGRILFAGRYDPDGTLVDLKVQHYNEAGRLVEETLQDSGGSLLQRRLHSYQNGHRVRTVEEQPVTGGGTRRSPQRRETTDYRYDESGRLLEESSFDALGLVWKTSYRYDEAGRCVEELHYFSDGQTIKLRRQHRYGAESGRVETVLYDPKDQGAGIQRRVLRYNRQGDVYEQVLYRDSSRILERWVLEYQYDPQGNWIQRMEHHCEGMKPCRPIRTEYRTIRYH